MTSAPFSEQAVLPRCSFWMVYAVFYYSAIIVAYWVSNVQEVMRMLNPGSVEGFGVFWAPRNAFPV